MLSKLAAKGYEIMPVSHARAILEVDFPDALTELEVCIQDFDIPIGEIIGSGGGESKGTQRLRVALADHGWRKINFEIKKTINGVAKESLSHEVDHVREFPDAGMVALEIEWNNKDPFFDRDLENFKRLHTEGAISVGIVITRGSSMHDEMWSLVYRFTQERGIQSYADLEALGLNPPTRRQRDAVMRKVDRRKNPHTFAHAWTDVFISDKFGAATTHWSKLMDRIHRGVGNPCPLLLIGLPAAIVTFDPTVDIESVDQDVSDNEGNVQPASV